ncbi:hypothetical protein VCHA29O37_330012 [Vibrio chagasii]|nr:hypothetical protein VCHA29O37_330012 [Vibrio chagasii]
MLGFVAFAVPKVPNPVYRKAVTLDVTDSQRLLLIEQLLQNECMLDIHGHI